MNPDQLIYAVPILIGAAIFISAATAIVQVIAATKIISTLIGAVNKAKAEGKTGQDLYLQAQKETAAAYKLDRKAQELKPMTVISSAISRFIILAFLTMWLWLWMSFPGRVLPQAVQQSILYLVTGFLIFTLAFVLLRTIAKLVGPHTNPEWIDVIAATDSKWERLEGRLLLISFFAVFASAFAPMIYLFQSQ